MTKWQEFPLRPQGRAWPGLNTLGGELDDGSGLMRDESTNVMINAGDTLSKRKGFVRGLDEFFDGVVCGLHRYTDECGTEWLLVADQVGIKIRQPFTVPVFENSDAYPFDPFTADGVVDPTRWLNRVGYKQDGGQLRIAAAAPDPMVWFKEASSSSYQVRIEFSFDDTSSVQQTQYVIIKAADNTALNARLQARLRYTAGSLSVFVEFIDSASNTEILFSEGGGGAETGFLTLAYDATTRIVSIQLFPQAESAVIQQAEPLTQLQAVDLGQWSGLQLAGVTNQGILVVDGGPV